MYTRHSCFLSLALLFLAVNGISQSEREMNGHHPQVREIVVMEVLQTTNYTYVQGAEKTRVLWMAVPRMDVRKGERYYYHGAVEMRNFKSKELDRVFPSIWFLNGLIHPDEIGEGKVNTPATVEVAVELPPGGVRIGELYAHRQDYEGKRVLVAGRVSKFNAGIMGRNWIHLQDGSGEEGSNDLTITCMEVVNVGDVVVLEGDLKLNKDFGSGYFYELILENGKIRKD